MQIVNLNPQEYVLSNFIQQYVFIKWLEAGGKNVKLNIEEATEEACEVARRINMSTVGKDLSVLTVGLRYANELKKHLDLVLAMNDSGEE